MVLTGKVPALAFAGMPLAAFGVLPVVLWDLLLLLCCVVDVALAANPKALKVSRQGPGSVPLGQECEVRVTISNPTRRMFRGVVRDAWLPSAGAHLPRHAEDRTGPPRNRHLTKVLPGGSRDVTTVLTPSRRGATKADLVTLRAFGPLGLAGRQACHRAPLSLDVNPPFTSRRHLAGHLARLRDLDGRNALRIQAQGTEFDSLREYVLGDDIRSIDWRATARSSAVMLRTWRPERDRRIVIVLDTGRTSAGRISVESLGSAEDALPIPEVLRDGTRLDASLDATLLLAAVAKKAGDRVDVLAYDTEVRADIRNGSLVDISRAIAHLEPQLVQSDAAGMVATILSRNRQRSLVVLMTNIEPAAMQESLLPVLPQLTSRHRVIIASVDGVPARAATGASVADSYQRAATTQLAGSRAEISRTLNRLGIVVVDSTAPNLPQVLAENYIALKSSGRL